MKKIILWASIFGSILFYLLFISKTINICDVYCSSSTITSYHKNTLVFPFILIFSLITYFAPERVFASWWKFARIAIPVAFIVNALLMYDMSKSTDAFDDIVYIPVLILIYGSFILGSAWQIWKGWRNK